MANQIKEGNTWLSLRLDSDYFSGFHQFKNIYFTPSSPGDYITFIQYPITFGTMTTATLANWPKLILKSTSGDTIPCHLRNKNRSKIYIPYASCSLASASNALITFEV